MKKFDLNSYKKELNDYKDKLRKGSSIIKHKMILFHARDISDDPPELKINIINKCTESAFKDKRLINVNFNYTIILTYEYNEVRKFLK